jgi:predicted  nucleic acid-binding Zn-ribbon protein
VLTLHLAHIGLSELKDKRDELDNAINAEESEKSKYEDHLLALQDRLQEVVEGLHQKVRRSGCCVCLPSAHPCFCCR